jgi:ribonuclease HI
MAALSPAARKLLQGLLQGKPLSALAPAGDPARAEVEEYLSAGTEAAAPRKKSKSRPPVKVETGGRTVAYSDGASRGNPGPAAVGIRVLHADGTELAAEGHRIGQATNNVAEYRGAIAALEKVRELGLDEVELRLDSELVVKQINGQYRVRDHALAALKQQVDALLAGFRSWSVRHVPRAQNSETEALDAS